MSPLDRWIAWVGYPRRGAFRRYALSVLAVWTLASLAVLLLTLPFS